MFTSSLLNQRPAQHQLSRARLIPLRDLSLHQWGTRRQGTSLITGAGENNVTPILALHKSSDWEIDALAHTIIRHTMRISVQASRVAKKQEHSPSTRGPRLGRQALEPYLRSTGRETLYGNILRPTRPVQRIKKAGEASQHSADRVGVPRQNSLLGVGN